MIIRKADKSTEAGVMPSEALLAGHAEVRRGADESGRAAAGRGAPAELERLPRQHQQWQAHVVDGPFTETKELIAGFTMIQVRSREEAIEWVKRWPAEDGDAVLEVRQVFEADDFGTEFTPKLREREERLRAQAAKQ